MASLEETNAAFEAAFKNLPKLIVAVVPDHDIPFIGNLRQMALQKFYDPQTKGLLRAALTQEVRYVLEAAEKVRAAQATPPPPVA